MSTLRVPPSLTAAGIVARGGTFAFAKAGPDRGHPAWIFGLPSVPTPYRLGAAAIAIGGADGTS